MITGEFLTADDLGPAGRFAGPGESLVLRAAEQRLVASEVRWVTGRMRAADRHLVSLCELLPGQAEEELDCTFDAMVDWTAEAVKYGLMASYLGELSQELETKGKAGVFIRSRFRWADYNVVSDLTDFVRVARLGQVRKFLDYAFTNEQLKGSGNRVYLAAAQMSMSMRRRKAPGA